MRRTRAAVAEAARKLFLRQGYAGTTLEQVAELSGITRRTLYNNYADKEELFLQIVSDVMMYAEEFARGLHGEFAVGASAETLRRRLHALGARLALGIVRPEVVAMRRLLIGEARTFPKLAPEYYARAPGQVLSALASGFRRLQRDRLLRIRDPRRAAAQFAYLVAGEPLDRAILVGAVPSRRELLASAREGVETFMARYGPVAALPPAGSGPGRRIAAR